MKSKKVHNKKSFAYMSFRWLPWVLFPDSGYLRPLELRVVGLRQAVEVSQPDLKQSIE